jgi:hypothetical protein
MTMRTYVVWKRDEFALNIYFCDVANRGMFFPTLHCIYFESYPGVMMSLLRDQA